MSNESMANCITDIPSAIAELLAANKQLEQELQRTREDIEFWKNEYVSHSETMCKCQEELQNTREQLSKAEQRIFHLGECPSLWEYQGICDCGYEQYFKTKTNKENKE